MNIKTGYRVARLLGLFASLSSFIAPWRVSAAPGDVYVTVNSIPGSIARISANGSTTTTFATGFNAPAAMTFDASHTLFVGDVGGMVCPPENPNCMSQPTRIWRVTPAGVKTVFTAGGLIEPVGMAFDSAGNLFVCDNGTVIYKYSPGGSRTTFATGLNGAGEIALDRSGNLYAPENGTGNIVRFTPSGAESVFISVGGSPGGLAFDNQGNLFVTEAITGGPVSKITPSGIVTRFGAGVTSSSVAFDTAGNLLVADTIDGKIKKFTPNGTMTVFASGYPVSWIAVEPPVEQVQNISARGLVGTADNVLIGGFILGGNSLATNGVVLRAIGPSLVPYGIKNPLLDPVLELHNASGVLLLSNDNWQQATQSAKIQQLGLAPHDPRESAIYATLPAGNFTAIVRGKGTATGIALVEVYSIP